MKLEYEVVSPGGAFVTDWQVEAIDYENDGQIYVTIFTGPKAEARAIEYAHFKNDGPNPP